MFVRIWHKDGTAQDTKVTGADAMCELTVLAQKYEWTIELIGKRPW